VALSLFLPGVCMASNWLETIPSYCGFSIFRNFFTLLVLSSLWKNPQDGRTPRLRLEGILHRLRAELLYCFAWLYLNLCKLLCSCSLPPCVINAPQVLLHLLPASFRSTAFAEWMRRHGERS